VSLHHSLHIETNLCGADLALGVAQPVSTRDREIGQALASVLLKRGLLLVGLDVIGDYLTEINVTSPTGVREIDRQFGTDIAGLLMDAIARRLPLAA